MAGNEEWFKVPAAGECLDRANQSNGRRQDHANGDRRERYVRDLANAAVGGGFLILMEVNHARGSGDDDEGEHEARD